MTARRHHFISQCYLRGFLADRERAHLFVTDFQEHNQFRTSPENIALVRDFHRVDAPNVAPDVVETELAKFESDLAPALKRISESASLADVNDREHLFFFMTLLATKTPAMRRTISAFITETMGMATKLDAADPERWRAKIATAIAEGVLPKDTDADEMRRLIVSDAFEFGLSTGGYLYFEFRLAPKLLPYFHGRNWSLYRAPKGRTGFITSDRPVCLMWRDRGVDEAPGFGRANTQIIFAVSNEVAILGSFEGEECVSDADDNFVGIVNGNILSLADRQIYARDDDFIYMMPHNGGVKRGSDLLSDPVSVAESVPTSENVEPFEP